MNKQQIIDAIYKEMADKTLSFGCKIAHRDKGQRWWDYHIETDCARGACDPFYMRKYEYKIIGHPVMIGDVIDWYVGKKPVHVEVTPDPFFGKHKFVHYDLDYAQLNFLRTFLRKPVEYQSDKCICFVHGLIK